MPEETEVTEVVETTLVTTDYENIGDGSIFIDLKDELVVIGGEYEVSLDIDCLSYMAKDWDKIGQHIQGIYRGKCLLDMKEVMADTEFHIVTDISGDAPRDYLIPTYATLEGKLTEARTGKTLLILYNGTKPGKFDSDYKVFSVLTKRT